jgi:hypothetical protein
MRTGRLRRLGGRAALETATPVRTASESSFSDNSRVCCDFTARAPRGTAFAIPPGPKRKEVPMENA